MNLIAAVDKNWAIGKNNQLLVRIPMDQKFFRETTTGTIPVNSVIKTLKCRLLNLILLQNQRNNYI